jgi:hypothetical protein
MKVPGLVVSLIVGVLALTSCEDVVTQPNKFDPNGPDVSFVRLCAPTSLPIGPGTCTSEATVEAGGGVQIRAVASNLANDDITGQCSFKWDANKAFIRVAANSPGFSAVVTANENALPGAATVTATCNGVSGAFAVIVTTADAGTQ